MLGEGVEPDKIDQNIKVTGLDLTESEDRTLSAIQKLLEVSSGSLPVKDSDRGNLNFLFYSTSIFEFAIHPLKVYTEY